MTAVHVPLGPGGGQSDSAAILRLGGLAEELTNLFYRAGAWKRRGGAQALHATPYGAALRGVSAFKSVDPAATNYELIAVTAGTSSVDPVFLRVVGSGLVQIPYNSLPQNPEGNERIWRIVPFANDKAFACRYGAKDAPLLHVTANSITLAGIPGPTAAPTVSDGASGTLANGTWGALSFTYVTADGQESSESPTTTFTAASGGTGSRAWTVLTPSTHPRVVKKRLYCSYVGASNVQRYFTGIEVPNATTSYTESVADSAFVIARIAPARNGVPPNGVEDVEVWQERAWIVTNVNGRAEWWYTTIDSLGPAWEAYSSARVKRIAPRGGRRAMSVRAWTDSRLVLLTDSSAHVLTPSASGEFDISNRALSEVYGVPNASCAAAAGGWFVWFNGRHVIAATPDGDTQIISRGWVDRALSDIPAAYVDRSWLAYVPEDGGCFMLAIPSTASSTEPDLALCFDPQAPEGAQWGRRGWFWTGSAHRAPSCVAQIPAGASARGGRTPEIITAACFPHSHRLFWLDSPSRRDEGPTNVHVSALSGPVPKENAKDAAMVERVNIGVDVRHDVAERTVVTPPTLAVSLVLDAGDRETTPVNATRDGKSRYIEAPAHNLDDMAELIQVRVTADVDHFIEVFDLEVEAVPLGALASL